MGDLRVRLLGGLVVEGRRAEDVGSRKARTVLAALAVEQGRPVRADALTDILWGEDLPARPLETPFNVVLEVRP